jgi:CRISPR-associated endonuclease/helicase Cas3
VSTSLLFWAKLGNKTWPEEYHPVICHLIDVGQVARRLWDDVCRPKVRQWVVNRLGLADESATGSWLAFWAASHDIGKVSPCFQHRGERTEALRQRLTNSGFDFPGGDRPHGDISTKVLAEAFRSADAGRVEMTGQVAADVAVAVGGHHGLFPTDWDGMVGPLGNRCWASSRQEILAELARLFGVTGQPPPCPTPADNQAVWMYLAGLTSVADWIGSNATFFQPAGSDALLGGSFDVDGYFRDAALRAVDALETLGWLGHGKDGHPPSLDAYLPKGREPRPLQRAVAETAASMDTPGLLVVEAPMGEGKTEAAWYVASCWERRGGQGSYVALPTMATTNQMFDRVGHFLESDGGGNLMLLHGKAVLNERFEKLKYAARVYDNEDRPSAVVAEGWFAANKKHGLLAPYGVGTIDQALLAVLQTKHVFVRLFGLAGKAVVLDEVHAYDAYMTTLMEQLLRWLGALGCPVVLLSATLPRDKRLKLLRAYAGDDMAEPEGVAYPRVTSVAVGGPPQVRPVQPDPARGRTVLVGWTQEDALPDRLRETLASGGCAAVIRNTVGLAQETYLALRNSLKADGIEVELFHARFPFGRRKEIEDAILRRFGKEGGPPGRHKRVLVATQVVEQSLDLDFDVMVSDVAPVDLVLQRAGRLHRHDRGPRPEGAAEPRLWLIQPPTPEAGLPDFKRYEKVYARFILLRSYLVLDLVCHKGGAVRLPDDLEPFVEQVYGSESLTIPDGWQAALDKAGRELRDEQKVQRMKAKGVMIYRPDDEDLLRQQNSQLDEDNPEAAEKIRAATRDTEPTIQVILIYHLGGRDYLDPDGQDPFHPADKPDIRRTRRLLDNEVTVNHPGCVRFYVNRPVPTGWRECGMLRHHRVVKLDASGNSLSEEHPLRSDRDIGVMFARNIEEIIGQ